MKPLNRVGQRVVSFRSEGHDGAVFFFDGHKWVASADRLGPARMVAPGTVAVSVSGRQWMAVGGDRLKGAAGWRFVSPYVDQLPVNGDPVCFSDNPKSLKIRAKLDAYLDYYQECKGVAPSTVVLRREQLSTVGALPGQIYKGARLEVFV